MTLRLALVSSLREYGGGFAHGAEPRMMNDEPALTVGRLRLRYVEEWNMLMTVLGHDILSFYREDIVRR